MLGGFALGYDAESETFFWVQVALACAAMLIYGVSLLIMRPYIDVVHLVLDVILQLLNILTLILCFLALSEEEGTQDAILWIVLCIQFPGIVFIVVGYLWSWMFYAGYTSPLQVCGCRDKPEPMKDDVLMGGAADDATSGPGGNNPVADEPAQINSSDSEALAVISLPSEGD